MHHDTTRTPAILPTRHARTGPPGWQTLMLTAVVAAAVAVGGCVNAPATEATDPGILIPEKSPNDKRVYRYLELENRLKVLLVSEPGTEKSAASLTVFRGSYHEPAEFAGLAHFLEHMLFIGTEKYPELDGYQQFLTSNGGTSNAYTAADHTNYFFDVKSDHLDEAMDRFAQFFISPLLDPDYVDREKNAVHSEYQLQIKDDGWRGYSAMKQAYSEAHPGSRFSIGTLDTLGPGVGTAMREFMAANYSADQMALVVVGASGLDDLQASVTERFSAVENRDIGPAPRPGPLFETTGPRTLTVQTLKDTHGLSFNFLVPSLTEHYTRKPAVYIANLLGHEGAGSLHAWLKARGWIESLSAGGRRIDEDNSMISIDLELTPAGAERAPEITTALFQTIDLIARSGIEQWRYDEQAKAGDLAFRFQEKGSPIRTVYVLSPRLMYTPPADVLTAPYRFEEFDPELIAGFVAALTPDNLLIEVAGQEVDTDRTEAFFGVRYSLAAATLPPTGARIGAITLPEPNPFLPDELALLDAPNAPPERVADRPGIELWLAPDTEFGAPRANQYLRIAIDGGLATPDDHVLSAMYAHLVADSLNAWAYPAQLAGLNYGIRNDTAGFRITLGGYDQKQPVLLDEVLRAFTGVSIDPDKFALYKNQLLQNWRNFEKERPYTQVSARSTHAVRSRSWSPAKLADALDGKTATDLERWRARKLQRVAVEGLLHGNVDQAGSTRIGAMLANRLPLGEVEFEESITRILDGQERLRVDVDHNDAAIAIYVQTPGDDYTARARTALLAETMKQSFFTELRTNQQLGYVVAARNRPQRNQPGLIFLIQSPVAGAQDLETAIETFLRSYRATVADLPTPEFDRYRQGLAVRLTEREKNLAQRSQRYWSDLMMDDFSFASQQRIATHVLQTDQAALLDYYDEVLARFSGDRLVVFSPGRFDSTAATAGD